MLGVVPLEEAKRQAYDAGLDLVEISPEARPPVCKIMDFGKFKYEQSKKEKANKAKSKSSEMKEVRLGRSMKIDPHDVDIRIAQARRFLIEGHRVQIIQNFRGREMAFRSRGDDRMDDIIQRLADLAKVEVPPRLNGRRMGMILVPEKQKIELYKRKMLAEGKPVLPTIPEQLEEFEHDDDDDDHDGESALSAPALLPSGPPALWTSCAPQPRRTPHLQAFPRARPPRGGRVCCGHPTAPLAGFARHIAQAA